MTIYLAINGVLFVLLGLRVMLKPVEAIAAPFGLGVSGPDSMNYLRSGPGGVTVAAGILMLMGLAIPSLQVTGVILAVTFFSGLVVGRLFSLAVDGMPGIAPIFSGVLETIGLLFGILQLVFVA